ncbi:MAG: hypothetical protein WCS94_21680 [Verrucomicrobiota bacterium]
MKENKSVRSSKSQVKCEDGSAPLLANPSTVIVAAQTVANIVFSNFFTNSLVFGDVALFAPPSPLGPLAN